MFHILTKQVQKPFLRPVSRNFGCLFCLLDSTFRFYHLELNIVVEILGISASQLLMSEILLLILFPVGLIGTHTTVDRLKSANGHFQNN